MADGTKRSAPKPTTTQRGMPGSVGPRTGPISPKPNSNPMPGRRHMDNSDGRYEAGRVGPLPKE